MPSVTIFKGAKGGIPKQSTVTRPDEVTEDKVLVRVTASGLCGTGTTCTAPCRNVKLPANNLVQISITSVEHDASLGGFNLFGQSLTAAQLHQDMVLGHEGVGIVESIGPDVKTLKKGDRVGWGYETDSCGQCMECLRGEEIYCAKRVIYGGHPDQGSFSSHAIWREAFLHPIPDSLSDEEAAPLQCAGATVFSALRGTRAGDTVGVMGVGGLGHLAIQFAAQAGPARRGHLRVQRQARAGRGAGRGTASSRSRTATSCPPAGPWTGCW